MTPNPRAEALLAQSIEASAAKIDRFFAWLFLLEWASRIGLAYFRPAYDDGLFTAIVVGAFIASVPTVLVAWKPGLAATRHSVAVAQMLYGALLIHLSAGENSTHIHLLFSLAVLALYRDPTVVLTGAAVGALQAFAFFDLHGAVVETMWIVCTSACLVYSAHRARVELAISAFRAAELEKMRVDLLVARAPAARLDRAILIVEQDASGTASTVRPPQPRRRDCDETLRVLPKVA